MFPSGPGLTNHVGPDFAVGDVVSPLFIGCTFPGFASDAERRVGVRTSSLLSG